MFSCRFYSPLKRVPATEYVDINIIMENPCELLQPASRHDAALKDSAAVSVNHRDGDNILLDGT